MRNQSREAELLTQGSNIFPSVLVKRNPQYSTYLKRKRLLDVLLSAAALLVLMPLFAFIAACIKLENPKGPVFFRQTRLGKDEQPFTIYKFRTMVCDAEQLLDELLSQNEVDGAMFKMKKDPRVTRVGKWLRKTSLDEIPQFWNVLQGQMSLVGPRPPLPNEVATYTAYDKLRLTVVPGCTGLWQVTARNGVGFKEMVELDLTYIRERSFWYDLRIMVKTIKVFTGSKNAF